jgi:uncharacterized alpha-E superfamily protein
VYEAAPHRLEPDLIAEMHDRRAGFSLAFNADQTLRVAGAVRDRLSADTWRLLSHVVDVLARPAEGPAEALEVIDQAILALAAAGGIETRRMTRDDGWRLVSTGRHIERLLFAATAIAEVAASGDTGRPALLEWLLELSDSAGTYRARYIRPPEWLAVADLLVCDRKNPRSAAFQLAKLAHQLSLLPRTGLAELTDEIEAARADCHIAEVQGHGLLGRPGLLEDFLARAATLANRLSDALVLRYFSHVYEPSQAIV